jgi:anion-transporting  ArsA/GET3 family ATPase
MKELVVISGKGGTGKTSVAASFAVLAEHASAGENAPLNTWARPAAAGMSDVGNRRAEVNHERERLSARLRSCCVTRMIP